MLARIAGFEFRYQLRQPFFWVAVAMFGLIAFGSVASENVQIGSTDNVHKNAPFVIAQSTLILSVIFMFVVAAFVGGGIVRDDETGFGPIIRSAPIRKFDYLYGRFIGAAAAAALAYLSVPVGLWLGSSAPWLDPETLGSFNPAFYAFAYLLIALPVILLCASLFFAMTAVTRSMMWTYVGVVALLVARSVFTLLTRKPDLEHVAALWDPFGFASFFDATRYWTANERNTLTPALQGAFLWSRLIWAGADAGLLALAYALFRFQAPDGTRRRRTEAAPVVEAPPPQRPAGAPPAPAFNARTHWAQLVARTRLDAGQVFGSPAYLVLLALSGAVSVINLWLATDVADYGGQIWPVTRVMMKALAGGFDFFALVIAIYYAGELVWREREKRTAEIIDATPVADWMFVLPKTLAIALVLVTTLLAGTAVSIAIQALKGYDDFEIGKYLLWYITPDAIDFLLIAALAIFIQTLSPHKFVGWAVMAVFLISTLVMGALGFEHQLYRYDGAPDIPLSDMNGQGRFWVGAYWFRLYWAAFALMLLVIAYALWRRGAESRLNARLRQLPRRLRGPAGLILAGAFAVFVGSGVFIFYNTNVLNPYRTRLGEERWLADYEKTFLRYEHLPQPKIQGVGFDIAVYPHQPRIDTRGVYVIQNRTAAPIRVLHIRFPRNLVVNSLAVQGGRLAREWPQFNYRIYLLAQPMQPGETRRIAFDTTLAERGFRNSGELVSVLDNGTFVNDTDIAPRLGMDRSETLQDRAKRRKYGLPPELRMPVLGAAGADQFDYIRHDADWVTSDITVSTDADQVPIAPGYAVSERVKDGRRTVRFVSQAPILPFFSVQSAKYKISTEVYKGVAVSVYYDPRHPWNVDRIHKAMRASLDYYQANYSPYQFRQVRVLEFPQPQGDFAESFANTIPWSEGIFFIADTRDPDRVDMVTYVGAHELGHQWWAHQVIGADEQGSTLLSETLAQYSAAMVMKHLYGREMMRKFLKFELDSYLRARGGAVLQEQPLARVENQPYVHYRKGSLVMYRLQDAIGEGAVNKALRQLLHDFAFKGPPYATSADLVRDLRAQAPADKQALITDLFERITLYDVKATGAQARRRADGRYDVDVTVEARKVYADGLGRETETPMNETLDVGAFDVRPGDPGYSERDVIATSRVAIHSGRQIVTLTVARAPKFAGVDPFSELIDRDAQAEIAPVILK